MNRTRRASVRLTLTMVVVLLVVIVFTGRLFQLQVVQAPASGKGMWRTDKVMLPLSRSRGWC